MQIHPLLSAKMSQDKREVLPVIIYSKNTIYEIRDTIAENFGQIKYELPFINAVAVEISRDKINTVAKSNMIRMIADDPIVSKTEAGDFSGFDLLSGSEPSSEAYDVHELPRHDRSYNLKRGMGTGVAVIDTGVAPHYDLIYPKNRIIAFQDFVNKRKQPYDDDGHGTHVAGIIAGNGFASRKYIGSAPCANLIAIKALDQNGNGTTSDILASMQWVINNRRLYNIRVVNLSLGVSPDTEYDEDPLIKGANAVVRYGITVVAAAGNSGPKRSTINSPGTSPYVITVGAADFSKVADRAAACVAEFSSRGPAPSGISKPDVLAPGVDIVSLSNENLRGYASQTGTSMATPVVSGVAACLYSVHPRLTPAQIKRILLESAVPMKEEHPNAQGKGVLNYEIFFEL